MAFPSDILGTDVQMKINNTWTGVTRRIAPVTIQQKKGVEIERGQKGLQDKTPTGSCSWTWHDPTGYFNNENPRSINYGRLPRNTPVRVVVPRPEVSLLLVSPGACWAPDSAGLSITGDIDIRIDVELARNRRTGLAQYLVGKYITNGNQRSWALSLTSNGLVRYRWSSDGISTSGKVITSTVAIPTTGRIAIRVTHDVNNGAAGNDVTFYTASTLTGSYTQLGAVVTTSGTTSIFDSTAGVEIGAAGSSVGAVVPASPIGGIQVLFGRVYGFEMRNGIAGSVVANPNFTAQETDTFSFVDDHSNTWTVDNAGANPGVSYATPDGANITNADYRFHGEFSSPTLKPKQSANGVGYDVDIVVNAGGIIQRISANETPVLSPIYLAFSSYGANLWISGEDASGADVTEASSGVTGTLPAVISDITFNGPDSTLPGSAGVMVCGSTAPSFVATGLNVDTTAETHFIGYFKMASIPGSETTIYTMYSDRGTVRRWTFNANATNYILRGYNSSGTETVTKSTSFGTGASPTDWIAWHMQLTDSAGTISIKSEWMSITSGAVWTATAFGTTSYAGTNGIINRVTVSGTGVASMRFAHVMASTQVGLVFYDGSANTFAKFSAGFPGETADERFLRICYLIGVEAYVIGSPGEGEQMGAQPIDTAINILYQCVEADGGRMIECVDKLALEYRTRISLCNQDGLSITYANLAEGLEALPDDIGVSNDIVLSRDNGGQARATLEYGPMSIQAPPDGINKVSTGPGVNNYLDSRLPELANHKLVISTWPSSRYPTVAINMHHPNFAASASQFRAAQNTKIGDKIRITSLPQFMAPDVLELLVVGIGEKQFSQEWYITFACVPYGPYITSELTTDTDTYQFYASHHVVNGESQHKLNGAIDATDTVISVSTTNGVLFDTSITNLMIKAGGEFMTVTAVSGTTSPQDLTVTRGVVGGFSTGMDANTEVFVYPTLLARL